MITHIPYSELGKANHGWLKANHHFSFAHYYNPKRIGFGKLRVINDDWVAPNSGFPPHPHHNMEIITFVRSGAITHEDSLGNRGTTQAGEVQVMSAGTGIMHSEYNLSTEPLTLYQIWIESKQAGVKPRWESRQFPTESSSSLPLLVSGFEEDKDNALFIYQDARIYGGQLKSDTTTEHKIQDQAYVLASKGTFEITNGSENVRLTQGDGAEITKENSIQINALEDSEVIVIDVPN
ncbi:pirin family protein [Alteromonadaceae bacterium M269]|nr:pirin family protein [Alteromonadaceae bacterium M269]